MNSPMWIEENNSRQLLLHCRIKQNILYVIDISVSFQQFTVMNDDATLYLKK